MTTEIVHPFVPQVQNTQELNVCVTAHFTHETRDISGGRLDDFIQFVELRACEKINALEFSSYSPARYYPKLCTNDLRSKRQAQPYAVARHIVIYFSFHDRFWVV